MIAEAAPRTWIEANQDFLAAEFDRIRALLAGALRSVGSQDPAEPSGGTGRRDLRRAEAAVAAARASMPAPPAIDVVARAFGLSVFERDVLLLAAGTEMDGAVGRACRDGVARMARQGADSPTRAGRPAALSFGLALTVLPDGHWSALAAAGPLRRWRLLEPDEGAPLVAAGLRIDERVLGFLAGLNDIDARLRPFLVRRDAGPLLARSQVRAVDAILAALRARRPVMPPIQLHGDDRDGQIEAAAIALGRLERVLFVVRATDLPATPVERFAFATLWAREAALLGAGLLVDAHGATAPDAAALELLPGPLFVAGRDLAALGADTVPIPLDRPDGPERIELWRAALGPVALDVAERLDVVAGQYRLSARAIASIGLAARDAADAGRDAAEVVSRACLTTGRSSLDDLGRPIEPTAGWDDLVLPESVIAMLREIAAQVRRRATVHDAWGFGTTGRRGLGISVLFAGESGTGKTMAAEVLAAELGLELYRIDLSGVVSKYIGETEKNLRRLFDAAEDGGAILLFDEADALFGRRSEVRDSHDRYANIEISYLLQRMEEYRGLAILTTNVKGSLDRAFQRRLRFIVGFPFPDAEAREAIWRRAFPPGAPVEGLDHRRLARVAVSGGSIRNIALNAAFRAADTGEPIGMGHILAATRSEFAKGDRPVSESETRDWV